MKKAFFLLNVLALFAAVANGQYKYGFKAGLNLSNQIITNIRALTPNKGRETKPLFEGITTLIGLFVPDVDSIMEKAVKAGGVVLSPAQTYDYEYRQGEIKDPFGHVWLIEKKTGTTADKS